MPEVSPPKDIDAEIELLREKLRVKIEVLKKLMAEIELKQKNGVLPKNLNLT